MASVLRIRFMSNGMQMMSSGADGLVKLWTIKSGECDNTFYARTKYGPLDYVPGLWMEITRRTAC